MATTMYNNLGKW